MNPRLSTGCRPLPPVVSEPDSSADCALRPRPHQEQALSDLERTLANSPRAQVVMACGSGKTLVARWYAVRSGAQLVLVAVPSLALIGQCLAEWRSADGWPFEPLIVCSDPSTAAGAAERTDDDVLPTEQFWSSHRAKVTTNAAVAGRFLQSARPGRPQVVFATYHSAPVVAQAAALAGVRFDLAVCDEAHRLAGNSRADFRAVLDDEQVPARRRVFMTATPVDTEPSAMDRSDYDDWSAPLSMADEAVFGPVAYRLSFSTAIASGLLADYEVLVLDSRRCAGTTGAAAVPAALLAAAREGLSRVLSFHGRVDSARAFAAAVDGVRLPDGRTVWARAVAGTDPAASRAATLRHLRAPAAGQLAVVSNARCLSEGVNLPALDGVIFASPKDSDVDVVQAVGRALRQAPGKTRGLIIIPVQVPEHLDDDTALSSGPYAGVWRVLRALRSLDDRFAADLDRLVQQPSRRGAATGDRPIPRVRFELPAGVDLRRLQARLVDATSSSWRRLFVQLQEHVAERGSADVPRGTLLGEWCERQRTAHRRGLLAADRARDLQSLPGWAWDREQGRWLQQWEQVLGSASRRGGLDLEQDVQTAELLQVRDSRAGISTIGRWCAAQRLAYRRGELAADRTARCQQIPGWTWAALSPGDAAAVDALSEYVAWKGHADVPAGYTEDGVALGRWLNALRRRRATGHLPLPLLHEVELVTPSSSLPGALRWCASQVQWHLGYLAMAQFAAREGHCKVPEHHLEALPDTTVALYVWGRRQRHTHRYDQLAADRVRLLEQLAGWQWEIQPAPRVLLDQQDLRHGTRVGYVKGCRCAPCTDANRRDHADRVDRSRAGGASTDWVDAGRARGHLRVLAGRGAEQKALARAAGLNVKTVVHLLEGTTERIHPATEQAVLAVTLRHVELAAAPGSRVDAAATWQLLDQLIGRGWPKAWLARELGQQGHALQLSRSTVTADNARRVAELAGRLRTLPCPPRRGRQPLPRLHQLLADAQGAA